MLSNLKKFFKELITPSDFKNSPYQAFLNQSGHIFLGLTSTSIFAGLYFYLFGFFPLSIYLWLFVTFLYLIVAELTLQGFKGKDTIWDTYFVGLGAALPLASLYVTDNSLLAFDIQGLLIGFSIMVISLFLYIIRK